MQTVLRAVTYDGSVVDTALNAGVLAVVVLALVPVRRSRWWVVLLVAGVLQVGLWFALGVVGVSVVWAALAGAVAVELGTRRRSSERPRLLVVAVLVAGAAIAYYAFALPPVSTVAHLLAVGLGAGLQALVRPRHASAADVGTGDGRT